MLPGPRKSPPRSPHPDGCDAVKRRGRVFPSCPSLLHVTRNLNKKRHTYCAARQETQLCSVEKLLHWDTYAATKRRPCGGQALQSHTSLPPQTRSSSPSCPEVRAPRTNSRTTDVPSTAYRANPRLPNVFRDVLRAARRGQPANVPTPREQKTHRIRTHEQILKLAEKEMEAKKKRRRAWILSPLKNSWIESHVI